MAGYNLSVDKTVKRIIPPYLRKPRQVQWVLALTYPLRYVNTQLLDFIQVKRVEASLNSQTQLLEEYLNNRFKMYFSSVTERIQIVHDSDLSTGIYYEFETGTIDTPIYNSNEGVIDTEIYYQSEKAGDVPNSFRILIPVSLEGNTSIVGQIIEIVNRYRISAFDFDIQYV